MEEFDTVKLGVILDNQIDEWVERVKQVSGTELINIRSSEFDARNDAYSHIEIRFGSQRDTALKFILIRREGHFDCFVEVGENADKHTKIFDRSLKLVGATESSFDWAGFIVIGSGTKRIKLETSYQLGESLKLEPYGVVTHSDVYDRGVSKFTLPKELFEIKIIGKSRGATWSRIEHKINTEIHRVSSLMSVLWDCLVIVSSPAQEMPKNGVFVSLSRAKSEQFRPQVCPTFLGKNYTEITKRKWLINSVSMFSEGVSVERKHPSLAMLAYVSSIESIGTAISPPHECPGTENGDHCPHCLGKKGASRAFRKALKLVHSNKETNQIYNLAYSPRSLTVHEAELHGDEQAAGFTEFTIQRAMSQKFQGNVQRVRKAARAVLLHVLEFPDNFPECKEHRK